MELLSEIFLWHEHVNYMKPFLLSHVCASWRQLAFAMPRLWTTSSSAPVILPTRPIQGVLNSATNGSSAADPTLFGSSSCRSPSSAVCLLVSLQISWSGMAGAQSAGN
ncbi:hypothetical protein BD626DRAFT_516647, partial [Schizophyllum amplum]